MDKKKRTPLFDIINIAWGNFDTWIHSPRTAIMLLFILFECIMLMKGLGRMMDSYYGGVRMHLQEMMALRMSDGCNLAMMSILLLITVNELPRQISFQNYSMIRSKKWKWLTGQILYCMLMVIVMLFAILIFMAVCALPLADSGSGWSDLDRIAQGEIEWDQTIVHPFLIENLSPIQAIFFCMIPLFLFWFTMLMIILFSGLFGSSLWGVLVYAFMLVSHVVFLLDGIAGFRFPSSYATFLSIVGTSESGELQKLVSVVKGYLVILSALFTIMYWRVYHVDFDFYSQNKY